MYPKRCAKQMNGPEQTAICSDVSGGVVTSEADRGKEQDDQVLSMVIWRNPVPEQDDDEYDMDDEDDVYERDYEENEPNEENKNFKDLE